MTNGRLYRDVAANPQRVLIAPGEKGRTESFMSLLITNLTRAGKPPVAWETPDGTRLLVLPSGGRLLGLFPPESDENFLWTNPALATAESATAYFARPGWPNPGGDRTWLAPEIELFIGDLARVAETYAVQPALDPGPWTLTAVGSAEVTLAGASRLRLHRSQREVDVRLGKNIRAAANPLHGTALAAAGLRYAGFSLITTLEMEPQPGPALRLGIWNLLQLPQPGVMLIPTRALCRPQLVFGAPTAAELTVETGLVRWHMTGSGKDAKISMKAHPLTGRAGHLRQTATPGTWDLVVREFAVDPAGDYAEALWDNPDDTGWVFQACCVHAGMERFNELEYHAPAVATRAGANCWRDESRVWAFRGPAAAIAKAADTLLGVCRT